MKKHTQKQILHLLAGLLVVGLAFRFFEREDLIQATILFGAGCSFLILAGAHAWIEKNIKRISNYFFFLEAASLYYAADHYKTIGNNLYYTVLAIGAVVFFILGFVYMIEKKKKHKYKSRRKIKPQPQEAA
jgi:tellurite resistance protein TehA-like permease